MAVCNLSGMKAALGRDDRLLGLDLGTKTIGLAISDVSRSIATPRETLRRGKFTRDAERLRVMVADEGVGGIIIGLPINMDGTEGPRAQASREFARLLAGIIPVPITLWDERLSTVAAERALLEADLSRGKRADAVDKVAAAYILQGALDRMKNL